VAERAGRRRLYRRGVQRVLNRRLEGLGTTIFAEMTDLARTTGSINLGQGFPDTDGPAELLEAAVEAIRAGHNQYPPGPGIPELRRAVADHQRRHYALDYDPDSEVLVTTGATEAIAASILALVEPGDEVVALEPYYDSYAACIAMAGGRRVPVALRPPDFRLDLDELRAAVTDRTRLLLVNSPHNPTGAVLNREELAAIAELAIERDLIVVTDEVYEHLVFDGEHVPLATLPGMRERTVSISSAAKTFSVTGWKVGWLTSAPELVAAVRAAKQFLTFVSGGPFQYAVAHALDTLPASFYPEQADGLRRKRDLLCAGLERVGFTVYRPHGTYFVTTDVAALGEPDGRAFCVGLAHKCGVVAVPNVVFYDRADLGASQVRFAYCKRDEVLQDAVERLATLA
jgi:N-succinyldiaminopimelate aminotransferase